MLFWSLKGNEKDAPVTNTCFIPRILAH